MIQLIFTSPDFNGQSFPLPEGKTTVGRAPGNTLVIEHDSISARHCEILRYGREVIIRDCASTNGIWVGATRVKGQTSISHGQRVRLGTVEVRLELPPPDNYKPHTDFTAIHLLKR